MAFKLGDIIIDRLQFGYGQKSNGTPLYVLTQLSEATIDISADSTDITDKDGNLVYRKYSGKTGEITATNAFLNLAIIETLSATDAEIATTDHGVVMPYITTVKAGATLDISNYVEGSVIVNSLNAQGSMGTQYSLGSNASETEFAIATDGKVSTLTPPTDTNETRYVVKYKKTVYSGAKITNSGDKFPTSHELFFKALAVDMCDKENLKPCIVHIPSFQPSPECSISLAGGDSQTLDYNGAVMLDVCSVDQELFSIYFIDEAEDID